MPPGLPDSAFSINCVLNWAQLGLLDIALAPVPSKGHGLYGHEGRSSFREGIKSLRNALGTRLPVLPCPCSGTTGTWQILPQSYQFSRFFLLLLNTCGGPIKKNGPGFSPSEPVLGRIISLFFPSVCTRCSWPIATSESCPTPKLKLKLLTRSRTESPRSSRRPFLRFLMIN